MRVGILSDIHADLPSLEAAFAHLERNACELALCAGDYVDYGPDPDGTIALLEQRGAICIRGNHDRWATSADQRPTDGGHGTTLSPRSLAFLKSLPAEWRMEHEGIRVVMWHASPGSDTRGILAERTELEDAERLLSACCAHVLVVGHTHRACVLQVPGRGLIINPGALLRTETLDAAGIVRLRPAWPLEGGTFGVLDLPECRFSLRDSRDGREVGVW